MSATAGWYADPSGVQGQLRWWDGARWTEHVTPDPNASSAHEATPQSGEPDATHEQAATDEPPAVEEHAAATESGRSDDVATDDADVVDAPATADHSETPAAVGATSLTGGTGTTSAPDAGTQPPPPTGGPIEQSSDTPAWQSGPSQAGGGQATWPSTSAQPAWADHQAPPAWSGPPPTGGGSGVKIGLIIAAVVGVVLLLIVGAFVAGIVGLRGGDVEFGAIEDLEDLEGFDEFDGDPSATVDVGELALGETVSATIPEDGLFRATITVDEPGTVVLDVRGEDDFDGMLELLDESGTSIAQNDDRDQFEEGRTFDPYLEVDLDPGTYTVEVRGWSGEGGSFELTAG